MNKENIDILTDKLAGLIVQSSRIVVFTGAGISTESGIPDFRGPDGIWTKFDPEEFTIQHFLSSKENRKKHWVLFAQGGLTVNAEPNSAHYAIAELEKLNKLDCVITQNVDNLHQKAGNSLHKVLELHGNMRRVVCLGCGKVYPNEEIMLRLKAEEVPECESCQGILKPDAVFFGEQLPQQVLDNAIQRSRGCDLFIVIGSTLVVYPAAYMPVYARDAGAKLAIINLTSTPMDRDATVLINNMAGETMAAVLEKVKRIMKN